MLSQQSKKDIKRKLSTIYSINYSKKKLNIYADEIFNVINKYNKIVEAIYGQQKTIKIDTVINLQDGGEQRIKTDLNIINME